MDGAFRSNEKGGISWEVFLNAPAVILQKVSPWVDGGAVSGIATCANCGDQSILYSGKYDVNGEPSGILSTPEKKWWQFCK